MRRPQSLGGISAGMEFLKVNIFKGKGGERERERGKILQEEAAIPFFFFLSFFF